MRRITLALSVSATSLEGSIPLVTDEDLGIQNASFPILLYTCKIWTVLVANEWRLEAFHMKCQRQITKIRWQDHIRNSEVAAHTGLGPVLDLITCRRNSFGHIARLSVHTTECSLCRTLDSPCISVRGSDWRKLSNPDPNPIPNPKPKCYPKCNWVCWVCETV